MHKSESYNWYKRPLLRLVMSDTWDKVCDHIEPAPWDQVINNTWEVIGVQIDESVWVHVWEQETEGEGLFNVYFDDEVEYGIEN